MTLKYRALLLLLGLCFCANSFALMIYGHRGAGGLSPENTLPAYRTGLAVGIDVADMDIAMTKDGVLVVTHDFALNPDITRDANGQWIKKDNILIKDLTLKQVQSYDVGKIKPGTAYAKLFSNVYPVKDTHIPTLKRVIEYVKRVAGKKVAFQIEIKIDAEHPEYTYSPERFAVALTKLLKKERVFRRSETQSFDYAALIAMQKVDPKVQTAYLTLKELDTGSDSKKVLLWSAGHRLKDYDNSIPKMIKALGGTLWDPEDRELTKSSLDEAHRLGLRVAVWHYSTLMKSVIDVPMLEKLMDWGVDGIITDRPDILRGLMAARKLPVPRSFQKNNAY